MDRIDSDKEKGNSAFAPSSFHMSKYIRARESRNPIILLLNIPKRSSILHFSETKQLQFKIGDKQPR